MDLFPTEKKKKDIKRKKNLKGDWQAGKLGAGESLNWQWKMWLGSVAEE